jgi:hypothetical protein
MSCGRWQFGHTGDRAPDGDVGVDVGIDANLSACASRVFANPAASTYVDDFSSGTLSDRWASPNPSCIQQLAGEVVAAPTGTGTSYCFAWANAAFHLTCDSITAKLAEVTVQMNGAQTFFYIKDVSSQEYVDLLLEADFLFATPLVPSGVHMGGYDPAVDKWWRVQEADGELSFWTSPDGVAWTMRGTMADPIPLDDVQIAIGAGTWQDMQSPGQARFRCYNVPPPCS